MFDERDFVGAFPISPTAFQKLFRIVRRVWIKSKAAGIRSKRQTVSIDIRWAIALPLLAGANKWNIIGLFRVKRSTVDLVFSEGLQVLDRVLVWPGLLQSVGQLHQSAMDFKLWRKPPSPFNGCVGALDDISVKIRKPIEVPSADVYYRKGFYALSVQALVEAH